MDYRDLVIADLHDEVELLKARVTELQQEREMYRAMAQEVLDALHTANQQRSRLVATVKRFMAITNGGPPDEPSSTPPPPDSDLSKFPTDTAPYASVHEIPWK